MTGLEVGNSGQQPQSGALVFDSESWNQSVCLLLSSGEDDVAEPTRLFKLYSVVNSDDPHYSGRTELSAAVSLVDNDHSGLIVMLKHYFMLKLNFLLK